MVELGEEVGVIAAQSIREPGTQLTIVFGAACSSGRGMNTLLALSPQ